MREYRFNPEIHGEEDPRFEFDPSESTPERKRIKPELLIFIPDGFKLEKDSLRKALEAIIASNHRGQSVQELGVRGLDYSNQKVYPVPIFFKAREIVGTEKPNGWAGLVLGFGIEDEYVKPQTLDTFFHHAQQIIQMDQDERNAVLRGIDIVVHKGDFFMDSDGRHRILTLRALDELGCDVTISGLKVTKMVPKNRPKKN